MTLTLSRRAFTLSTLSVLAAPALIRPARAASGPAVAAVFPGSWEDAYRKVVAPIAQAAGADVTVAPALAGAVVDPSRRRKLGPPAAPACAGATVKARRS